MTLNPVSSTHTANGDTSGPLAVQHPHLPTTHQGLPEPDAGKTRLSGSEGAPAQQCAGATRQNEGLIGEIKTSQRGSHTVLASATPDGVRQDIWAHLTVHHLTRDLIWHAAVSASPPLDPERISFRQAQHLIRRSLAADLPPRSSGGSLTGPLPSWLPG